MYVAIRDAAHIRDQIKVSSFPNLLPVTSDMAYYSYVLLI
jgi:hypothetical protein